MADLASSLKQLAGVWAEWSLGRKAFVIGGSVIGVAGFLAVVALSGRIDYSTLMTGMEPSDTAKVVEVLDDLRVPYKLAHNGSTVLVPAAEVPQVRMKLAGEGLRRGAGVGFEIFDDPAFGISRFTEQLNYRRALEGELGRTIKTVGAVKEARVHIVIPKRQIFREKQIKPSASVTLHMQTGRRLSQEQVSAVVHLVASSVEGVSPEDVTVVDSIGKVLARGGGEGFGSLSKGLEHQRSIEKSLETRVVEILERVVGIGRVSAQVSAELDFTQSEATSETYDPEAVAVRSEQLDDEERALSKGDPRGIPGARSNLAGGAEETEEMAGANKDSKSSKIRNYEISKKFKREMNEVAQLKRLSVAVLVDGIRTTNEDGESSYQARTPEDLVRLTELVKSAVGFDGDRGDNVVLDSMSFSPETPYLEDEGLGMGAWDYFNILWRPLSALVFLFLLIGVMRATRRLTDSGTDILEQPRSVQELEAALASSPGLANIPGLQAGGEGDDPDAAVKARPDPEKAAAVIKGWLTGG